MIKYKFTLSIGISGAAREDVISIDDLGYDQESWEDLTDEERDDELQSAWEDFIARYIDGGWELCDSQ